MRLAYPDDGPMKLAMFILNTSKSIKLADAEKPHSNT
jgi:hypothetical protein